MTRASLLAAVLAAVGLAALAAPGGAHVSLGYSTTGDTATVRATWEPRSGADGYLVEWVVSGDSSRVVVDSAAASIRVQQGADDADAQVCLWTLNSQGRPSRNPTCETFVVPRLIPLIEAPEGLQLEIETAPEIRWDSLRVVPSTITFEALGETRDVFAYLYRDGAPWSCVTLDQGSRGWARVGAIDGASGAPTFPPDLLFHPDPSCGVTWTTTDDSIVSVIPGDGPPLPPTVGA